MHLKFDDLSNELLKEVLSTFGQKLAKNNPNLETGYPWLQMDRSPRLLGVRRSYANQKSGPTCPQTPANSFGIGCITKEQSKISYYSFFWNFTVLNNGTTPWVGREWRGNIELIKLRGDDLSLFFKKPVEFPSLHVFSKLSLFRTSLHIRMTYCIWAKNLRFGVTLDFDHLYFRHQSKFDEKFGI